MKWAFIYIFFLMLIGCNSNDAKLSSIQGSVDPALLPPFITNVSYPLPAKYGVASILVFTVTFSKPVEILGIPSLRFNSDDFTYNANCITPPGSVSTMLTFQYTVAGGEYDTDGITIHPTLLLNGGSIYDNTTNEDAKLSFIPLVANGIRLDTADPVIGSITADNGIYNIGDSVVFTVNYDYPVFVTGVPRLRLGVAAGFEFALYSSGSGTKAIKYVYNTFDDGPFREDYDGLNTYNPLEENGGTLRDAFGDPADLIFTDTPFLAINPLDGKRPIETARSITPSSGDIATGTPIDFTITYDETMIVGGTPRISLLLDNGTYQYANYIGGSGGGVLQFRWTPTAADFDSNGIVVASTFELNGGSIQDRAGNAPSLVTQPWPAHTVTVNIATPPVPAANISSFIGPSTVGSYFSGRPMTFGVTFNSTISIAGTGTPQLPININGTNYLANFSSISGSTAYFTFSTPANIESTGVTIIGSALIMPGTSQFLDSASQVVNYTYTAPATYTGVVISSTPPFESGARTLTAIPATGWFKLGDTISFELNFNEAISVSDGTPHLNLTIGSTSRTASFDSGSSNTTTLRFNYVVQPGDYDTDGITIGTISSNSSSAKDVAGNSYNLNIVAWPSNAFLVDGNIPSEAARTSPANSPLRILGSTIDYSIQFSENVVVTGNPRVVITIGLQTVYADYVSNAGNVVNFSYTVVNGNEDLNGIASTTAIDYSFGTIKDIAGNVKSASNLPWPAHTVNVDARAPTISSISPGTAKGYTPGQTITFQVAWSEPVTLSGGLPSLSITMDSGTASVAYAALAGNTMLFSYTVGALDLDLTGIAYASFNLNGAVIKDSLNQIADTTLPGSPTDNAYIVPDGTNHWYDTSNILTNNNGTTSLAGFKDIMGLRNGSITGGPISLVAGVAPGTKYANFTGSGGTYITLNSTFVTNYALFVVDTSGTPSGDLYATSGATPYISLSSGIVNGGTFCSVSNCEYLDPLGSWSPSSFGGDVGVYGAGRKIIVVDFRSVIAPSTAIMRIGRSFNGKVHEVMLFSGANSRNAIDDVIPYLQTKYGAAL